MRLGSLTPAQFLARYWQKRPLLVRGAFPGFRDPLTPEELAGLACEPDVEARLVFTRRNDWKLKTGPFNERDFTSLPERNWTLLVQAVDQWVPEVKELLRSVDFIPSWRVDDVMISYATKGGGVGPHFDYYDVFLVQGQGTRVWKTGQRCSDRDIIRTASGLKLLREFHTEHEWTLEPGDMLYVPPGIAHWGVSNDDSLCYSIGFRAPSVSEMLQSHGDSIGQDLPPDLRYTDPLAKLPLRSGEIDAAALKRARGLLNAALRDDLAFARWFGRHMTEAKYPELALPSGSVLPDLRDPALVFEVNPASRFAWQQHGDLLLVFADGECSEHKATKALLGLVQALARPGAAIAASRHCRNAACRELCAALLRQGTLREAEA